MDPALASLLGVTAQDTADVERRVLAEVRLSWRCRDPPTAVGDDEMAPDERTLAVL